VKTYVSIISNLAKKMGGEPTVDYFRNNQKEVLDFLKDVDSSKRKTLLSALVVLTSGTKGAGSKVTDIYREQMMTDIDKYKQSLDDQTISAREKDSWISQDQVKTIYNNLYRDAYHLLRKPELTSQEMKRLMDLVILSVYYLIPPRRALDYISFKVRDINKDSDNYMSGLKFYFNKYKTAKNYGQQIVPIPQKLFNLIKKWSTKHSNDYLLFDDRGNPLTQSKLNSRLHAIFGGKAISVNMLRKIFLTDKYQNVPELRKMAELAEEMGHSVDTALEQYVKPAMNEKNEKLQAPIKLKKNGNKRG
jgi:hypothetical protein